MPTIRVNIQKRKIGSTFNVVRVYRIRPLFNGIGLYLPLSIFASAGDLPVGIGASSAQALNAAPASYQILTSQLGDAKKMVWANLLALEDGEVINGQIVTSASAGALTVQIKTADGSTPSASNPVLVMINRTLRAITSSLSLTVAAGTNTMNLGSTEHATKDVDVFAYLAYRTASSAVVLGFSRIPMAGSITYSTFSATATNEKYIVFSTTPASGDYCVLIGRFNVTLSAGAGYTWTIPATSVIRNARIFETRWLSWTPVHSRTGTNYTNLPTTNNAYYQIKLGRVCISEQHTQNATPGGTLYQSLTLPFTPAVNCGLFCLSLTTAVLCGGIASTSRSVNLYKYDGTAECTGSNAYTVQGEYRM